MRFSREEICEKLKKRRDEKSPVLVGSAGLGLIGRLEEIAGADIIMTCASDYFRMDGRPSALAYYMFSDANDIVLNILSKRVIGRVGHTPLIAGLAACDPYRDMDLMLEHVIRLGYSGVINSPANYSHGERMEKVCEKTGYHMTFAADRDFISKASKMGLFTIAYVFNESQAGEMALAGADVICPHTGLTVWELGPYPEGAMPLDEAIAVTAGMARAAKSVRSDIFVLCHGGLFNCPENVQKCFDNADVDGYIGTSAFDSQPVYESIRQAVEDYLGIRKD